MMEYNGGGGAGMVVFYIIYFIVVVAFYVAFALPLMKIGDKKGFTGWFAWVPILNIVLIWQISGKPVLWLILALLVPCIGWVFGILILVAFMQEINKPWWWILLGPLVLIPLWQAANE